MAQQKRIAVVTGASSGLGAEFLRQLERKEVLDELWVIARNRERLEALGESLHTPVRVLALDLTRPESMTELSRQLEQEQPEIGVLINAAGFGKIGSWKDISLEDSARMVDLNCKAAMCVTRIALDYMKKGDRVLEICSTAAFQPFQYLNVYAASKAFLYRYSRALRMELLTTGIHVTAVCPYWVKDTEFIPTARKTGDSHYIRHFPLASRRKNVVRWALIDSRLNLPVSTPGPVCLVHRIVAKFVPHFLMLDLWALIRRI